MDKNKIIETIRNVISEEAEIPKENIQEDSLLMSDLDLSSMEVFTIVGLLEEEFFVETDVSELNQISTVGELADYIASVIQKGM